MPLFTDEQVQKLLGPDAEAEGELDLRGVQATEALSLLEQVVIAPHVSHLGADHRRQG